VSDYRTHSILGGLLNDVYVAEFLVLVPRVTRRLSPRIVSVFPYLPRPRPSALAVCLVVLFRRTFQQGLLGTIFDFLRTSIRGSPMGVT